MYFFKFLKTAIANKGFKAIIMVLISFLLGTAVFGGIWYLIADDAICFLETAVIQFLLMLIMASPLGEKFATYMLFGNQKGENNPAVINSLTQAINLIKPYRPNALKNVKLVTFNNDSSINCDVVGENTIIVSSGICNLDEERLLGGLLMSVEGLATGSGLGYVVCVAANSIVLLPYVLWDYANIAIASLFSNGCLGSFPAMIHKIDTILLENTYGKLLGILARNSLVSNVPLENYPKELVDKCSDVIQKYLEASNNLS